MTFVVVGGGPTGVELAGAIAELARFVLAHDFRRINPKRRRFCCLKAGPASCRASRGALEERGPATGELGVRSAPAPR